MCKETNRRHSFCDPHTICLPNSETVDRVGAMEEHSENGGLPPLPPKNRVSLDAGSSCPVCGSDMVTVRGKYQNSGKRIVCPACLADCIDMIRGIIDRKK